MFNSWHLIQLAAELESVTKRELFTSPVGGIDVTPPIDSSTVQPHKSSYAVEALMSFYDVLSVDELVHAMRNHVEVQTDAAIKAYKAMASSEPQLTQLRARVSELTKEVDELRAVVQTDDATLDTLGQILGAAATPATLEFKARQLAKRANCINLLQTPRAQKGPMGYYTDDYDALPEHAIIPSRKNPGQHWVIEQQPSSAYMITMPNGDGIVILGDNSDVMSSTGVMYDLIDDVVAPK
jgi:hypothetical protein